MKKATRFEKQGSQSQIHNISKAAQCERLLADLIKRGSITTYQAREQLNIVSPAARVLDLRGAGHDIHTSRETLTDGAGFEHPHSARYVLLRLAEEVLE